MLDSTKSSAPKIQQSKALHLPMNKYVALIIFLVSNCALSCEKLELPRKMEWTSGDGQVGLFISVPEYYKEHKYAKAMLTSGKTQVSVSLARIDYPGWVSTTIKGSKEFFSTANLTVSYKKLGSYHQESNSFGFVACYAEYDIGLKM